MSGSIAAKPPSASVSTPVLGGDVGRVNESMGKATPAGATFGTVLATARPILKGAESVASVLPGGPLIAAAVRAPSAMGAPGSGVPGAMGGVAMAPRVGTSSAPLEAGAPGGAGAATEGTQMESVLADSQAFNMYYLQLQEEISAENRQYSALSNVLKARHDTVKNAIGNIR